jgi:hypothetical protein
MGEENTTLRTQSGAAGARTAYQIARLVFGIVELLVGSFLLYVGVAAPRVWTVVAGLSILGLGIRNLMIYRGKRSR